MKLLSTLMLAFLASPANAENAIGLMAVPFTVESVLESGELILGPGKILGPTGRIRISSNTKANEHLWGVDPNVVELRKLVLGKTVLCKLGGARTDLIANSGVGFRCFLLPDSASDSPTSSEVDVAAILISTGRAKELCEMTSNFYGTCKE